MAGLISFGFENNGPAPSLAVSGPWREIDHAAQAAGVRGRLPALRNRSVFKSQKQDSHRLIYVLNSLVIGNARDKDKLEAIRRANDFIHRLGQMASSREVMADPKLDILAYEDRGRQEFDFELKLNRPNTTAPEVRRLMGGAMVQLAQDLKLDHHPSAPLTLTEIRASTYYTGQEVLVTLDGRSSISSHGPQWREDAPRMHVIGNEIQEGAHALIYLAGAVALAHADELAKR